METTTRCTESLYNILYTYTEHSQIFVNKNAIRNFKRYSNKCFNFKLGLKKYNLNLYETGRLYRVIAQYSLCDFF